MKKHDEGYVLAFVLVVVAVLTLISTAVSTIAVRNIETQQAAVERMQKRYEAEGAIEKIVAELSDLEITEANGCTSESDAKNAFDAKLTELCGRYNTDAGKLTQSVTTVLSGSKLTCTLTVESVSGTSTVKTDITLENEVKQENGKYIVGKPAVTYAFYETGTTTETTVPAESNEEGAA